MKRIGIAAILALGTLACQREEETPAGESPAAASRQAAAESHASATSPEDTSDKKSTRASERPANPKKSIPVAEPAADQPGFVKSPFSGKLVDVRGIPSGSLVADPSFPAADKKYFRVPEMPNLGDPSLPDAIEEDLMKGSAPLGRVVPGKPGFIFSPYDNKIIDATGIEPGTVIRDPSAPPEEIRYIRIPGGLPPEMDEVE